jgi:hypothetical protein
MKNLSYALLVAILICFTIDMQLFAQDLSGKWTLEQILLDPGDGSGKFQTVNSEKTIIFNTDGTAVSNVSLCLMSIESKTKTRATYSPKDKSISPINCNKEVILHYQIEDDYLIVYYRCKEGCAEKYKKSK